MNWHVEVGGEEAATKENKLNYQSPMKQQRCTGQLDDGRERALLNFVG